jgi:hypothetical protein
MAKRTVKPIPNVCFHGFLCEGKPVATAYSWRMGDMRPICQEHLMEDMVIHNSTSIKVKSYGELPDKAKERFLTLCCQLSPENLCCDGELPRSAVNKKLKALGTAWGRLEKAWGITVTEDEVYSWDDKQREGK